jgi:hypothetical protein
MIVHGKRDDMRTSTRSLMKTRRTKRVMIAHLKKQSRDAFDVVREIGLTMSGVEATTRYDGSPMLKVGGSFMAGLATHASAEPNTLVVRYGLDEREWLLEEAPDVYYLTDYYRRYPLVLVRLSRVDRAALADLLSVSRRLTVPKERTRGTRRF